MAKASVEEYLKMRISLKYWLLGKEYFQAVTALSLAAKYHAGTRKDMITPEFEHQIAIGCYARTLSKSMLRPEETFTVAFLHDIVEDYHVPVKDIEAQFSKDAADAVWLVTKKFKGLVKDPVEYYDEISGSPSASIIKGIDRFHNMQTIHEVFTKEKQALYIQETEDLVLPMLKKARKNFPAQECAYENIKHALKNNISLLRALR